MVINNLNKINNFEWNSETVIALRAHIGNSQTNIIPIIIGNTNKTILISKKLEKKGIYIVPIRPPSVPSNTSRLRISISSNHSQNDIKKLFNLLKNLKI